MAEKSRHGQHPGSRQLSLSRTSTPSSIQILARLLAGRHSDQRHLEALLTFLTIHTPSEFFCNSNDWLFASPESAAT